MAYLHIDTDDFENWYRGERPRGVAARTPRRNLQRRTAARGAAAAVAVLCRVDVAESTSTVKRTLSTGDDWAA